MNKKHFYDRLSFICALFYLFVCLPALFILDNNETFNIEEKYVRPLSIPLIILGGLGMSFVLFKNFIQVVRNSDIKN